MLQMMILGLPITIHITNLSIKGYDEIKFFIFFLFWLKEMKQIKLSVFICSSSDYRPFFQYYSILSQ